jgi:transcription factor SFP1
MVMMGTSPSAFHHSSSFQSSSYLPKMEATLLRDFQCCDQRHANMHDFVSHMEEVHGDPSKEAQHRNSLGFSASSFSRQTSDTNPTQSFSNSQIPRNSASQPATGFQSNGKSTLAPIQDIDGLEDMEMEDSVPTTMPMPLQSINTGLAQGFRPSAPTTPSLTTSFNMFSQDPTVSSVNTPTLSTAQMRNEIDSSITMSPLSSGFGGYDSSLAMFSPDLDSLSIDMADFDMNMPLQANMNNMTIHDPAKRLSSKHNGFDPAQLQFSMNNNDLQLDGDFQRALQQQQLAAGIPLAGVMGFPGQEEKKYRCPVIGCEKAYKNQNGLKYHKQVSFYFLARRTSSY